MVINGAWKPIYVSRVGHPPLANLFFVDDLILFGEATVEQAKVIKCCLELFYLASGQKVSTQKSLVFSQKYKGTHHGRGDFRVRNSQD